MPTDITLQIVSGHDAGREHVFDEPATVIIGRARDCTIRLPSDEGHRSVSRHHCLVDISPPRAELRDFGSLNGTEVNGRVIGGRNQPAGEPTECPLANGDEFRIGETVFKVRVRRPPACRDCGAELPPGSETDRCRACADKAAKPRTCAVCGRDVSVEAGDRSGVVVCGQCRQDPLNVVRALMGRPGPAPEDAPFIQGYEILRALGRGGMGAVFLARNRLTGQEVALKVMLPQTAVNEQARDMFLREARLTKALDHPNVVRLMDSGCSAGTFFFTLEYCDGGSVDGLMERSGGRLSPDAALPIAIQALRGLEYAHQAAVTVKTMDGRFVRQKGLVHRDLKPQNLFLSGSGPGRTAKVADLGLSKAFRAAGLTGMTATGMAAGSPWFMPRQQVVRYKYSSPAVDVWAMAATLYTMLTGAYPRNFVRGRDPWLTVLQESPIPIRQRRADLPPRLAAVIDAALVEEPEIAFDSAAELRMALEAV